MEVKTRLADTKLIYFTAAFLAGIIVFFILGYISPETMKVFTFLSVFFALVVAGITKLISPDVFAATIVPLAFIIFFALGGPEALQAVQTAAQVTGITALVALYMYMLKKNLIPEKYIFPCFVAISAIIVITTLVPTPTGGGEGLSQLCQLPINEIAMVLGLAGLLALAYLAVRK